MEPCAAAVPLRQHSYIGRMVGGDPIIDHEHTLESWAGCGEPSVAAHEYRCEHGHVVRKPSCAEHAPEPGSVGCRQCYDQGHECEMQISRA